jgi:hypothetical protein
MLTVKESSMKTVTALLVSLVLPVLLPVPPPPPPRPLALTHVTVIDGTGAKPRRDQTVVIAGDRIAAIGGSGRLKLRADTQTFDATGRFLIPGLWDMHVHSAAKFYLPLFVANGVTGIRTMDGDPEYRLWHREVEEESAIGPRMLIASPVMDGPKSFFDDYVKLANADEARAAIRKARQEGAEFIKVHDLVPRDAYFALIDEARQQGLPVAGTARYERQGPQSITPEEASDAGRVSIEHLTQMDDLSLDGKGRGRTTALLSLASRDAALGECPAGSGATQANVQSLFPSGRDQHRP